MNNIRPYTAIFLCFAFAFVCFYAACDSRYGNEPGAYCYLATQGHLRQRCFPTESQCVHARDQVDGLYCKPTLQSRENMWSLDVQNTNGYVHRKWFSSYYHCNDERDYLRDQNYVARVHMCVNTDNGRQEAVRYLGGVREASLPPRMLPFSR